MNEEQVVPLDYYQGANHDPSGIRYRLEGEDVISQAVDTLKGGVIGTNDLGDKVYNDKQRCMNDVGILRARMVLQSGVNKVNHLTKYFNEDRIHGQIKSIVKAWIFEVTLNMKSWAPEAFIKEGKLVNSSHSKVRNKRLIIQTIEQALYQSMLRGTAGFEANLTAKSYNVQEINDNRPKPRMGGFGGVFGRQRPPEDY